jgi:hypothetical protein
VPCPRRAAHIAARPARAPAFSSLGASRRAIPVGPIPRWPLRDRSPRPPSESDRRIPCAGARGTGLVAALRRAGGKLTENDRCRSRAARRHRADTARLICRAGLDARGACTSPGPVPRSAPPWRAVRHQQRTCRSADAPRPPPEPRPAGAIPVGPGSVSSSDRRRSRRLPVGRQDWISRRLRSRPGISRRVRSGLSASGETGSPPIAARQHATAGRRRADRRVAFVKGQNAVRRRSAMACAGPASCRWPGSSWVNQSRSSSERASSARR